MSTKSNETPSSASAAESPPPPTAKDVASAIAKIVEVIGHLPPPLQLRALGGAATALGVDKDTRSRSTTTTQQRSNNNNTQQRGNQQR
jgi:hypothetical protein